MDNPNTLARVTAAGRAHIVMAMMAFFCLSCGGTAPQRFDNSILWSVEHPVTGARSYVMGTIHHIDTNHITLPLDQIAALIAETDFLCMEVNLSETGRRPAESAKAMVVLEPATGSKSASPRGV